jgi:hypothetical protein
MRIGPIYTHFLAIYTHFLAIDTHIGPIDTHFSAMDMSIGPMCVSIVTMWPRFSGLTYPAWGRCAAIKPVQRVFRHPYASQRGFASSHLPGRSKT